MPEISRRYEAFLSLGLVASVLAPSEASGQGGGVGGLAVFQASRRPAVGASGAGRTTWASLAPVLARRLALIVEWWV